MSEIHAKLYFYDHSGAVKEVRRTGLHLLADHASWPAVSSWIQELFAVDGDTVTYEDPEKDHVVVGSQAEWVECLRLGPYSPQCPLRLHVKQRRHTGAEPTLSGDVTLVPVNAYTTDGSAIPQDIERIKGVVPDVIRKFLQADGTLPAWLRGATAHTVYPSGEVDVDVDVDRLARLLSERALCLLSGDAPDPAAALALFQDAHAIKPATEKPLYNIACCHALLGATEEALKALEAAISLGYGDYHHLMQDKDLRSLWSDPRFCSLASQIAPPAGDDVVAPAHPEPTPDAPEVTPNADAPPDAPPAPAAPIPEPEAEPVAPAAKDYETITEPVVRYAEQLQQLRRMGFTDEGASLQALEQAQGSITVAIDKLLA